MARSPDNPAGLRVLRHCLDVGLNFFDSANSYGMGGSEELLGRAVAGRRDQAVICTKLAHTEITEDAREGDVTKPAKFTRELIFRNTEWSLKRLGTDYIDFVLLHNRDDEDGAPTSLDQIVDAMDRLVQAGKARYWGLSNRNRAELTECLEICAQSGKAPLSCVQNNYGLLGRGGPTEAMFGLLRRTGLGFMAIGPHAAGQLAPGAVAEPGSALADLLGELERIAGELCVPRSQVCIAWVLSHPELTTTLAGAESPQHVDDNLAGSRLRLPNPAIAALNAAGDVYKKCHEPGQGRAGRHA